MAENREEVLSQLYALRGSISYMSERIQPIIEKEEQKWADIENKATRYYNSSYLDMNDYDDREFINNDIKWYKIRNENLLPYKYNGELAYLVVTEKYKDGYNFYEEDVKKQEDEIKEQQGVMLAEQDKNKRLRIAEWGCFATILFGIFLMILFISILNNLAGYATIGGILIALGIIGWIFFRAKVINSDLRILDIKPKIKRAQEMKDKYIKQDEFIQTSKNILGKAVAELESIKDEKAELAEELRPVYYATVDAYSNMIDERDWEYLDVVIYYFETKRADSIKEALQLVDRMVQTNMIISAVETASKDIQGCIYNACRVLSDKITAACDRICSGLNSVVGAVNMQSTLLVSAVDMQNALYEQSNRTSSQMAADIKYIKEKTDKISKNRN